MHGKEAFQQLVHVPGFPDFLRGTESDGLSGGSGTRRAADAVHIDLRFFRQIIVDDKPYVFTSMPRAAMSVATRTGVSPERNSRSMRSRLPWLLSP